METNYACIPVCESPITSLNHLEIKSLGPSNITHGGGTTVWGNEPDIYSRLLRERIVFLGTPVDDAVADSIVAQLLFPPKTQKRHPALHQFSGRFSDSGNGNL